LQTHSSSFGTGRAENAIKITFRFNLHKLKSRQPVENEAEWPSKHELKRHSKSIRNQLESDLQYIYIYMK